MFGICDIGEGATRTRVSLNSDRPSIGVFTMHLTIIFRYKVTNNTNISGITSKKFLSHVKTKNELFIWQKSYHKFQKCDCWLCSELYNKMYFKFGGVCTRNDDAQPRSSRHVAIITRG